MENTRPSIFEFTDYRAFLAAFYDWQKTQGFFSHRTFADRAGLSSRSYLRLVLTGKRNLTPDSITKFIRGLELKPAEADAFASLVHFNQAADFESRRHYWEAFLKCRPKTEGAQKIRDVYSYLTRMAYPVLLNILRQPHVDQSSENLSRLTGLSPSEINEALRTLASLGAIVQIENGRYHATSTSFCTNDDIPNVAIQSFHRNILSEARERLELAPKEREFQSVIAALSSEEFLYLKKRLRDIADEIDAKFSGSRKNTERIYAVNLNLIPVTPEFIRREESASEESNSTAPSARQNSVAATNLEENFI